MQGSLSLVPFGGSSCRGLEGETTEEGCDKEAGGMFRPKDGTLKMGGLWAAVQGEPRG